MNRNEEIIKRLKGFDSENKSDEELVRILNERTKYKVKAGKDQNGEAIYKTCYLTDEQKLDFLYFAERNELNPIYDLWACCAGGELRPYISINGWCNILQKHITNKTIKGVEWNYSEIKDITICGARLTTYEWIECTIIFSDDRRFPFRSTIYDNFSNNDVWKKYAGKMLQNKVLSGALRMYVSKEKLYDDDEIDKIRMLEEDMQVQQPQSKSGEMIRKIKSNSFGNIQNIALIENKLRVNAKMDATKILNANGFSFNKEIGVWEREVLVENEDLDTILVQNNVPYNSKNGINSGASKIFYQVLRAKEEQIALLQKLGFILTKDKGYIKAV